MKFLSAGAAETVTGSCHLLDFEPGRVLVDCGLFQGGSELTARNHAPFPFEPRSLDAVILTHGHLDHVGRLPKLVREGFDGPIYATRATRRIAEVILEDAAKLQDEDYRRALRKARRAGREGDLPPPLFDQSHVTETFARFASPLEFDKPLGVLDGIALTLRPAGHILGSAWLQFDGPDGRIVASGDLGNRESLLHLPPVLPPECDVVLVETTYGNRNHRSREATIAEFLGTMRKAVAEEGLVMIPSFSLERAQAVLHQLRVFVTEGELPRVPVFLDSPMAIRMTELYQTCANEFRPELRRLLEQGRDPFDFPGLEYLRSSQESIGLNHREGPAVVIAGSGMMTGGRILHHLKHHLWQPGASLVVVGYQAEGTLGRRLIEGAERVRVFGEEIIVRAEVHTIGGFSAHADRDDLLAWLAGTGAAEVFLVHGEPAVMRAFAETLGAIGRKVHQPVLGKTYTL